MTPSTTLAAVFHGPGRPLELREVAVPAPKGPEVLVEVLACTLCGSDLHSLEGRRSVAVPTILGHEILGRIAAFGPDASRTDSAGRPIFEGDRVTWAIVASCGECVFCRRDLPQKCERAVKYGHEPMSPGRELTGGLAGHVLLARGTSIFRVPDHLPDALLCPANCATATVANALEAAGPIAGRSVLVMGCGMLGVTAAGWASARGADAVLACDLDPARRDRAAALGAQPVAPGELADAVMGRTNGRGVDVALELTGSADAIEAMLPLARIGGTVVMVGAVAPTRPVAIDPEQVVRRCLTIRGLHNYAPRHLRQALDFLATPAASPLGSLVGAWHPLAELQDALDAGSTAGSLRIGVRPG